MELSAILDDETTKGKKRSIDEVVEGEKKEEVNEKEEKEDSTDNPLLNLKFSANQSILDDVPRQKVSPAIDLICLNPKWQLT
jgi:hypothetical protein